MPRIMKKQEFFFGLFLAITFCCMFAACKQNKISNESDYNNIIQAYGPSILKQKSKIYVSVKEENLVADPIVLKKAFNIDPLLPGNVEYRNGMLEFTPNGLYEPGTTYTISIDVKSLYKDVNKQPFVFKIDVAPQFYEFQLQDIALNSSGSWSVKANLNSTDLLSDALVEKYLKTKFNKKQVSFQLERINDKTFSILVQDLTVQEGSASLNFSFEGLTNVTPLVVPLSDTNDFKHISTFYSENSHSISFVFNQNLEPSQNLNGLVKSFNGKNFKCEKLGNKLNVYLPKKKEQGLTIVLDKNIKSNVGQTLSKSIKYVVEGKDIKPQVEVVGVGNIIPFGNTVLFPFKAQGLDAIQIGIKKIYSNNIFEFWQENSFNNSDYLRYLGEWVHVEKIGLESLNPQYNPNEFNTYAIDLNKFINLDPHAYYEVHVGFSPNEVINACGKSLNYNPDFDSESIFEKGYRGLANSSDYNWKDRQNPCKLGYYGNYNYTKKLIFCTDIGVVVKKDADSGFKVVVVDIPTGEPLSNVPVELISKAKQVIATSKTSNLGIAHFEPNKTTKYVRVQAGESVTVMPLHWAFKHAYDDYNVGGRSVKSSIDGMIYGERSVWRPGDILHLNFLLFDKRASLPSNHPIHLSIENPKGKEVYSDNIIQRTGPFYAMNVQTTEDWITGVYRVAVRVGNNTFFKNVQIETIKPNRLSIYSSAEDQILPYQKQIEIPYKINYLHGMPGKDVKLNVDVKFGFRKVAFDDYGSYLFDSPRKESIYYSDLTKNVEAITDASGNASLKVPLDHLKRNGTDYKITFANRATESSGDFSSNSFSVPLQMYDTYVGLKLKNGNSRYVVYDVNKKSSFDVIALDAKGAPAPNRSLKATFYKMKNYWWWSSYDDEFTVQVKGVDIAHNEKALKTNAKGKAVIENTFLTNGRYFVNVCDMKGNHCAGQYFFVGDPYDQDLEDLEAVHEISKLQFETTKKVHKVGERVELNIPSIIEGKALISIENGSQVLDQFWKDMKVGSNKVTFTAEETMFPAVYAHVSIIQPYAKKTKNTPLRMFGVTPILVQSTEKLLEPIITTKEVFKPNETVELEISEKSGNEMYYTLSIVEEGLLNITNFKTPNPFNRFFQKEKLGVTTFDFFDYILSNYNHDFKKLYAVGGDGEIDAIDPEAKTNRFEPVVKHLGTFKLEMNKRKKHVFNVPNYIGAVRVMVVAAKDGAFGSNDVTVPVKQDLMVQATLPRSLSPGDNIDIPITSFVSNNNISNVDLKAHSNGRLTLENTSFSQNVEKGENLYFLKGKVGKQTGTITFDIQATSGAFKSSQTTTLQVEQLNPIESSLQTILLRPNEEKTFNLNHSFTSDYSAMLGISSMLPLHKDDLMKASAQYPHYCLEQQIANALVLLLGTKGRTDQTFEGHKEKLINNLLRDLWKFEHFDGYTQWPQGRYMNPWISCMVYHFMVVAKKNGYQIPDGKMKDLENQLISFAKKVSHKNHSNKKNYNMVMAYVFYVLSTNDAAPLAEMNRLKEDTKLDHQAKLMLAHAYYSSGNKNIADVLLSQNITKSNSGYNMSTFSSSLQKQMIQTFNYLGVERKKEGELALKALSEELLNDTYMSTQERFWAILILDQLPESGNNGSIRIEVENQDGSKEILEGERPFMKNIASKGNSLNVKNVSDKPVFLQVVQRGKRSEGNEIEQKRNIEVNLKYVDLNNNPIDPKVLKIGQEFKVLYVVKRMSAAANLYDQIALTIPVPAGWEILNDRLAFGDQHIPNLDFLDIRDRKVQAYMDLSKSTEFTLEMKYRASYGGVFHKSAIICESMYFNDIYQLIPGSTVEVVR